MISSISSVGFSLGNTNSLTNNQFSIFQQQEQQYGKLSALGDIALNNPALLENPQFMAELHQKDKAEALRLEQSKVMQAVYEKLGAENKRLNNKKPPDPYNLYNN
jgi:hypothetical protein